MIWGILIGATISLFIYAIVFTGSEEKLNKKREAELLLKIKRMEDDFEQERKGYNLMLRIKDEQILKLKEMLNDKSRSDTDS